MNRAFWLMAEFERTDIPLEQVAAKYLPHMSESQWKRAASERSLPFPVFRPVPSQKAPWLVNINDLAAYLDAQEAKAKRDFRAA